MAPERKSTMISARLPAALVERLDFAARNMDGDKVTNRSTAILDALEARLLVWEDRLRELGVLGAIPKKR